MPRSERAKQFAPFDALKGLSSALRIKEYEHERVEKGDLSEEAVALISSTLISLNKGEVVSVVYFDNGVYKCEKGPVRVFASSFYLTVNNVKVAFDDIKSIEKTNK